MTIAELLKQSVQVLKNEKIESASLDCRLLLCEFLGVDKLYLIVNKDKEIGDADGFYSLLKRRAAHEPMQYILGRAEFMGLRFRVGKGVLVPRPDTEILVERVIGFIGEKSADILDIGTGSGCISVSVLKNCPKCRATAVDVSNVAIKTATGNAKLNGVDGRADFVNMDILKDFPNGIFDCIVSNPPYIEEDVIKTLESDVKDYEPHLALSGGADGLVFYRRIAAEGIKHLKKGGLITFEVGCGQAEDVAKILDQNGYVKIGVLKDLAGIERVVSATIL